MNIGGYELSAGSIFGKFNFGGVVSMIFWGMMIFIAVGVFAYVLYKYYKNKTFYSWNADLTTFMENGTKKTMYGLKGGKFVNSNGIWDFKIKIPKQWKKKEIGYMPDFSLADADGTLHFITSGDGTIWQQAETRIVISDERSIKDASGNIIKRRYDLLIKPVPTDIKTVTVNSMKNWREMINKNKLTAFTIAIGAFIIMVITHIISLYIQTKIRCPTP